MIALRGESVGKGEHVTQHRELDFEYVIPIELGEYCYWFLKEVEKVK